MSRQSFRFLLLAVFAVTASCGVGERETDAEEEAAPAAIVEPQPAASIIVNVDTSGIPTVSEDLVTVGRSNSPVVEWISGDQIGERVWVVAFGTGTPFQNGRAIFSNARQGTTKAPVLQQADTGVYKYWVFVSDSDSTWTTLDPRLRIREDPGTTGDTVPSDGRN